MSKYGGRHGTARQPQVGDHFFHKRSQFFIALAWITYPSLNYMWYAGILVTHGCHRLGGFKEDKFILSQFLEASHSESRCHQGSAPSSSARGNSVPTSSDSRHSLACGHINLISACVITLLPPLICVSSVSVSNPSLPHTGIRILV